MAVKDKLISNEVLKAVNDNMQGQVTDLKSALNSDQLNTTTYRGIRSSDNKWVTLGSGGYGILIKVSEGDKISITARSTFASSSYFLASLTGLSQTTAASADIVGNENVISANNSKILVAPSTANYIFIWGSDGLTTLMPSAISVNGYDQLATIKDNIVHALLANRYLTENNMYDAYTLEDADANSVVSEAGQIVSNQYTTGYYVTDYIPVAYGDLIHFAFVRGRDLCGGCVYDSNKNFIAPIWGTPDNSLPTENYNSDVRILITNVSAAYVRYNVVLESLFSKARQYIWITKNSPINKPVKTTFHVGQSKDFSTIRACSEYIKTNKIERAKVYVDAGVYDLTVELADVIGSSYDNDRYAHGIQFGFNSHWVFSEGAYLKFNYDGSNVNVADYFSPLVICGSCTLENLNIEVGNCQYCVHDDWPERMSNWIVKYVNCVMKHNGNTVGTYTGTICIGGGLLPNELVIVDGGKYECPVSYNAPISYHSIWQNMSSTYPSRIIFKNIWISGSFRLQDSQYDCNDVDVQITNCSQGAAIVGTHTFFTITEWNNIIRT